MNMYSSGVAKGSVSFHLKVRSILKARSLKATVGVLDQSQDLQCSHGVVGKCQWLLKASETGRSSSIPMSLGFQYSLLQAIRLRVVLGWVPTPTAQSESGAACAAAGSSHFAVLVTNFVQFDRWRWHTKSFVPVQLQAVFSRHQPALWSKWTTKDNAFNASLHLLAVGEEAVVWWWVREDSATDGILHLYCAHMVWSLRVLKVNTATHESHQHGRLRAGCAVEFILTATQRDNTRASFSQASCKLRAVSKLTAWLSWKARSTLKDAPRLHHGKKNILVQAGTSSSQENEQACVRSHASRNALLSPRCSLTCSGAVPLRSRCTIGCQESTGPKSFPEQVWNAEHGNISTGFMKLGRCEDGQLSCCTFVKLDLCPKRRTTCFQGWDLSLGSFHAYSIRRGPPGMVHWGSAEHCGCQTWQSKTFLRSFTDQLTGCFSFVYCI